MDSLPDIPQGPIGTVIGILAIILGLIAIIFPVPVFELLVIFIAVFAIIVSAGLIRSGLSATGESRIHRLILVAFGLVGMILAILVFVAPYFINILAKDIFGIWAIIVGLGSIQNVFAGQTGFERWLNALFGLVLFVVGVLIFLAPALLSDYLLVLILGIFAIISGAFTIWFSRLPPDQEKVINRSIYK